MNNNNYARRTEINVAINDTNITSDINSHLLSLTYTDTEDENDDLRIELGDREGIWLEWLRGAKGATISASIIQRGDGDKALDCGIFEIDSVGNSGPPAKMSIRATSLPYSSTVRNTTTTKEWENIGLSAM
ncbi:MAG: hypothetical protein FWF94_08805 [Oscillospiraceae bacterium]|nr:hypothetical protein [Oscillospiraceae bacterium]